MSLESAIRKVLTESPQKLDPKTQQLVRLGVAGDDEISQVMRALRDPEAAMKNPKLRETILNIMQRLMDIVINDPTALSRTKSALRKEELDASDIETLKEAKKMMKNSKDEDEEEDDEDEEDEKEDDDDEDEEEMKKETKHKMAAKKKLAEIIARKK